MMVPSTAIKICIREKYFDFSSRASRSEFWFYTAFFSIFMSLMGYCVLEFGPLLGTWTIPFSMLNNPLFKVPDLVLIWPNLFDWLYLIVNLLLSIPLLSALVRRIHDVGKSGWWLLIVLVPILGAIYLLYLFQKDGEAAINRFGVVPNNDR
jgi:uncharacterized membrane protein YhaH (DUF805 family)|tara:strand:+ start:2459 stop:2911 length:453 start_codon:yes stop_codon:yes gene_type:complete